ncbi:MAG: TIGR04283 family arsenosugar biosynthesis glycosyltransferase [Isosphaeraceae bacterium]
MRVSVIIPTWNEARAIAGALESLNAQEPDEIIVVDAGSPDGTATLARAFSGVIVVEGTRGRSAQQNLGAVLATGEILLFLHADCRLSAGSIASLRSFARSNPKVSGGCFRMRVDHPGAIYRIIDAAADLRAGLLGVPYGDQAIFTTRDAFAKVGGFPRLSLMEDLFLSLRLRRLGRIAVLTGQVKVSPRRWRAQGVVAQSILNWSLTAAAALGVSPNALARFYAVVRESDQSPVD